MIQFDSSVVIDARDAGSLFHDWAKRQIAAAVEEGGEGGAVIPIVISQASARSSIPTGLHHSAQQRCWLDSERAYPGSLPPISSTLKVLILKVL